MIRHAIFVLVLVGAAFAGGAAINGPGLAWLQRNFVGGPTIIVDGSSPTGDGVRPSKRFPSASLPPILVDLTPRAAASAKSAGSASASPTASNGPPPGFPPEASVGPASQPPEPTAPAVASSPASAVPGDLPPLDLPPNSVALAKADPVARLASAGGLDSASMPGPAGTSRDWVEIRQRLKALGVSRYTIDAEVAGRVRFSCVIPVDGLRAVGHHFEAEGDDEFQAVDATLRRVALWKATEPTRTEP